MAGTTGVNHTLSVRLARRLQAVLIVSALAGARANLAVCHAADAVIAVHLLHEIVVLRHDDLLLTILTRATLRAVDCLHVFSNDVVLARLLLLQQTSATRRRLMLHVRVVSRLAALSGAAARLHFAS